MSLQFPFIGNKSNHLKILDGIEFPINSKTVIVDVFGGSGVLSSYFAKRYPNNQVIYNDFDHFVDLVKNKDIIKRINNVLNYSVVPLNNKLNEVIILCNF